jgi:hypothetical protein
MRLERYVQQLGMWPQSGRHILAQFDATSICVYQAYGLAIARYATAKQRFGGQFSFARMSWIKPNFLWMMYRCGWASKAGQERVLAITLPRVFFDELLGSAVPSSFNGGRYPTRESWQAAVAASAVRLQWDPDHDPLGRRVERRAVQVGLRGDALRRFATTEVLRIEDITDWVVGQRANCYGDLAELLTPVEAVYDPGPQAATSLGLNTAAD